MFESVRKYLFIYKRLQLPGIGTFMIEQIPARIDNAKQQLYSPLPVIRFSHEVAKADKQFFEFLANDLDITELDVVKGFSDLILQFKNEINEKNILHLSGIGTLIKENPDTYSFHPENNIQEFYPYVPAVRTTPGAALYIKQKEAERKMEVKEEDKFEVAQKETWWIYALILAGVSIAAIVFYYIQHGKL